MRFQLTHIMHVRFLALAGLCVLGVATCSSAEDLSDLDRKRNNFFESKIRPSLVKYCAECHSATTEVKGGLSLDSRMGWQVGGDSGPAVVAGDPAQSRLIKAISYEDANLQMPPDGKLPSEVIDAFSKWVADGAYDPRKAAPSGIGPQSTALSVERAQEHWSYRPLTFPETPTESISSNSSPIDHFIDQRLSKEGLVPAARAEAAALVRRLYFDLLGLPPSAAQLKSVVERLSDSETEYRRLVDRLLDSPQFGENIARKWMDVARYAESVTLRGFVLPEAWRYRDYLIQAFSEDRPFDQMIREQVAGDLLKHDDLRERQMQLVATGFLAMGNTNLEEQDKGQLEMDYIDEQLEVLGSAFLGQTIGCARCHNHKFDPIPTRDYYALAGILRSAVAMEHENVSKWIEQPLPLPEEDDQRFKRLAAQLADLNRQIAARKKVTGKKPDENSRFIPLSEFPGVIVDSLNAKLVGNWTVSKAVGPVVGDGYLHDENADKGKKTATFEPPNLQPGNYDVRLAYTASENRATNTIARVFSADGEASREINQRLVPPEDGLWISLGKYRFEKDGQSYVLITNDQSNGYVIADAVQFLPIDGDSVSNKSADRGKAAQSKPAGTTKESAEITALESMKKKLETQIEVRPRYLTIVEKAPAKDIPIHIRGDVHNLGEIVPRGFLSAIRTKNAQTIAPESSGRVELAEWISSSENPLTARVYANRVWSWIMGQGIVPTMNNFGTTGVAPTHPELLDWLAGELIQNGWSTKHLVRTIVLSEAYRRSVVAPGEKEQQLDPSNQWYWRAHVRRLPVEALRDAMLLVSGELDRTMGGSTIRNNTKADYNYEHNSPRRSIYQPLLRNSLPELFEAFDFADSSVSIGQRSRTTVATQALVLMNHPWVAGRAKAAALKYVQQNATGDFGGLITELYWDCFGRPPTSDEVEACQAFLAQSNSKNLTDRLQILIHSLFATLDFRYLE